MVGHPKKVRCGSTGSLKPCFRWGYQLLMGGVLVVLATLFSSASDAQTCPAYVPAGADACTPVTPGKKDWHTNNGGSYSSEGAIVAAIVEQFEGLSCPSDAGSSGDGSDYWPPEFYGGFQIAGGRRYNFQAYNNWPDCDEPVEASYPYWWSQALDCPDGFDVAVNSANTASVCYKFSDTPDEIKNLGGCAPASPPLGPEPPEACPLAGSPINVATLNKFETQADYVGSGTFPLVFTRYYNSQSSLQETAPPAGVRDSNYLGLGWTAAYFQFLHIKDYAGTNYITAYRPDGRGLRFVGTTGVYASEVDVTSVLTRLPSGWQLTTPDGMRETYAVDGRLISIRARHGETQSLTYNSSNQLASVSDDFGHVLQFEYSSGSANAKIASLVDPSGHRTYYSTAANLSEVTYADGTSRKYVYRSSDSVPHLLTGIIDENNSRLSYYTYDSSEEGNAIETSLAGGVDKYVVTGEPSGYWRSITEPSGNERGLSITTIRGIKRMENSGGFCESCPAATYLMYDAQGNVSSRTDANGGVTNYTYNLARNLETSRIEAAGTPRARTVTTQWHSTFRLPTLITEPKRKTSFTYDSSGNVLTRTITDTSVTPNAARTWTYTYDALGRVLTEDGPLITVSDVTTYTYYNCAGGSQCGRLNTKTDAVGHVTTFTSYNAYGQPTSIVDANGVVTTITYDLRQRITSRSEGTASTTYEYWPTGSLKKISLPDGTYLQYSYDLAHRLTETQDSAGNRVVYTLDNTGNLVAEERFDPSGALARTESRAFNLKGELWQAISATTSGSHVTEYTYDDAGNEITKLDPLGRSTTKSYDELNRLNQITTTAGGIIKYGYDGLNNLTSITDTRNRITSYTYNGLGDLTKIVSPDSGTSNMTYDENGNLLTRKDARNIITSYSYDATNRVATVDFGDQLLTYTYDAGVNAAGRLTAVADSTQSQSWTYDAQGRVTSATQVVGASSKSTIYAYTNAQLTLLTTPAGHSIGYTYTDGRVSGISVNGAVLVSAVIRDPFGALRQWTWGNSSLMVRTYDLDGRPTQIDSGGDLRELDYDEAGRVIANVRVGSPSLSWTYAYNDEDQLVTAQRSGATYGWTYDANGNRSTQTGVAAATSTIASTSNRMTSSTGALPRTYTYDAAGNIKTFSNRVLAYNNRGRLGSIAVGGVTTSYLYNSFGYRVKKSGAQTTYFVYDEMGHLLGEYDGSGALIQEFVWLDDVPVATLRPNGAGGGIEVFYIHADHLNTPRRVTRASNNAAMWTWDPDPFGQALPNENPAAQGIFKLNLRFPGQYHDAESGLHYNHHRDYDPATGRYVQSDPIGLTGGMNPYLYVNARPHSVTDPSGLAPELRKFLKNENTTCCDNGVMTICMENPDNSDLKCEILRTSMEVHENSHLKEFRALAPKICTGVVGKRTLGYSDPEEVKWSELTAFNVQLDYINKRRGSACSSPYCEGEIRYYIDWILNTAIPRVMNGTYGR